eukprot:3480648-Rhodomonas_salina.1
MRRELGGEPGGGTGHSVAGGVRRPNAAQGHVVGHVVDHVRGHVESTGNCCVDHCKGHVASTDSGCLSRMVTCRGASEVSWRVGDDEVRLQFTRKVTLEVTCTGESHVN